jgi:PAS domain S-box-containing protein
MKDSQRSDERFRLAVESAPNAMLMVDEGGRIVLVNKQAEKLFGYSREELLQRSIETLVPERFRAAHPGHRKLFFEQPRSRSMGAGRDLYGLRKDGSEVPVEIGLNPIQTEEGSFVLAAVVDITERKRAEERFRAVVESAPSAMVMIDRTGRIVLVNKQTEKLFGYSREELLGQSIELLVPERFRGSHPGDRSAFFKDPASRPMGAGRELFAVRKDGVEVPVEIGLNPIQTQEGAFVLAAVVDITARKRAQTALAQKNEEVEAFVYIVSHDLRTPLVNLQGFSKELEMSCARLREKLKTDDPEVRAILEDEIPGALRFISASTHKFERLINALLGLSRTGRREYRNEAVDLAALVGTTLDSLRGTIEKTGARVAVGSLPTAWGDATSLGQVFSNLIANALSYLKPGRPGLIEIGGERAEQAMNRYWVRDNGVGIPATARERVFQVFQRFHPELAPGEGMGLAIVKRVVERHGGKVGVETREGEGTTFSFTLPSRELQRQG